MTTTPIRPVAETLAELTPKPPLRRSTEIQGNVLAAFNKDYQNIKYLHFTDRSRARAWLAGMLGHLSVTADVEEFNEVFSIARRALDHDPDNLVATWTGLSITYDGLLMLAANEAERTAIKKDLKGYTSLVKGAAGRAAAMGDTGASHPKNWKAGGTKAKTLTVHAVVTVASDREDRLTAKLAQLAALDAAHLVKEAAPQEEGRTLKAPLRGHEHFGFKDGISQPGVAGFHRPDPGDPSQREGHRGAKLIPAGEFVFGYPTAKPSSVRRPPVPAWLKNGSLMVLRRLQQDVPGWNKEVKKIHDSLREATDGVRKPDKDEIGACLVGRFMSGQPLAAPVSNLSGLGPDENNFDYKNDPMGRDTPCAAHIRKTHPRSFTTDAHRVMRRGIPYGPQLKPGTTTPDRKDRGLLFVCFNTSLENQFEFIQQMWANDARFAGGRSGAPTGVDPVIGPGGKAKFDSRLKGEFTLARLVRTTAAVYGMTLSMSTLRRLAAGERLPHGPVKPEDPARSMP